MLEPVDLSNGLDWTGDRMYYADTPTQRVDLLDYDDATGAVENRRPFVTIDETDGVARRARARRRGRRCGSRCGAAAQVRRYGPDGALDAQLAVPADNVTACWFAGDRLFITTAASPQPLGGSLFVAEPGVVGPACAGIRRTMITGVDRPRHPLPDVARPATAPTR